MVRACNRSSEKPWTVDPQGLLASQVHERLYHNRRIRWRDGSAGKSPHCTSVRTSTQMLAPTWEPGTATSLEPQDWKGSETRGSLGLCPASSSQFHWEMCLKGNKARQRVIDQDTGLHPLHACMHACVCTYIHKSTKMSKQRLSYVFHMHKHANTRACLQTYTHTHTDSYETTLYRQFKRYHQKTHVRTENADGNISPKKPAMESNLLVQGPKMSTWVSPTTSCNHYI